MIENWSEKQEAHRVKMAEAIFGLVAPYRTLRVCYGVRQRPREIFLKVTGPYGLVLGVRFWGDKAPADSYTCTWSTYPHTNRDKINRLMFSSEFRAYVAQPFGAGNLNHARTHANGFKELYAKLQKGFNMVDAGSAFEIEGLFSKYSPTANQLEPAPEPDPARLVFPEKVTQPKRGKSKKPRKNKAPNPGAPAAEAPAAEAPKQSVTTAGVEISQSVWDEMMRRWAEKQRHK